MLSIIGPLSLYLTPLLAQVTVKNFGGQEEVITSSWAVCFKALDSLRYTG